MKFHDYKTIWELSDRSTRRNMSRDELYQAIYHDAERRVNVGIVMAESSWYRSVRPYYKLWPSIIPALLRIPLDIDSQLVVFPEKAICLRMPCTFNGMYGMTACLASVEKHRNDDLEPRELSFLSLTIQRDVPGVGFQASYIGWKIEAGCTVENAIRNSILSSSGAYGKAGVIRDDIRQLQMSAIRLVVAVALLASDPEIITPDILAADRGKYQAVKADINATEKLVERAKKRGKVGWCVGEKYETIPHYRRPHPALYHVGKGRHDQRIVFRSGAVVHRQKLTAVPTGYIHDDGTEEES